MLPICMGVLLGQMVHAPMHVGATCMHVGAIRADESYSHACGCYLYEELGMWVLPICMWVLPGQMVPTPMHVGATYMMN